MNRMQSEQLPGAREEPELMLWFANIPSERVSTRLPSGADGNHKVGRLPYLPVHLINADQS